jgi:hypothetical protein
MMGISSTPRPYPAASPLLPKIDNNKNLVDHLWTICGPAVCTLISAALIAGIFPENGGK